MFNKQLLLILLVSLALNGLFGYLSYHFYGVKQGLKVELVQCQASNTSLEKSVENHKEICKIQDSISTEWNKEEQQVERETDSFVEQLDKQVVAPKVTPKGAPNGNLQESDYVNLDGELSPDTVRVLSENCLRAKGSSCPSP